MLAGVRRLAIFIGPHEAHVEIEARVGEVVRVAAEEGDLLLGREHQPDILVALEPIELVLPAPVHAHHLAGPVFLALAALLLDGVDHLGSLSRGGLGIHLRSRGPRDAVGYIGDLLQLIEEQPGTGALILSPRGVEAVGQEVLTRLGRGLDAGPGAVMIAHHQSVPRNERRGAAVAVTQRRELDMGHPAVAGGELVPLGPIVLRGNVERPHLPGFEAGIFPRLGWPGRRVARAAGPGESEPGVSGCA